MIRLPIAGLTIGHAEDPKVATGTTVVANFDRLGIQVSLAGHQAGNATGSYVDGDLNGTTLEIHWPASRGLPDVERLNKDPDEIHGEEFALDFAALEALILPQRLADLGPGEAVAFDRLESDADHVVQARYRIEGGPSPTLWINDIRQPGNGASLDLTPQQLSALDRTLDAYRIVNASERPQEDMALAVYWVESRRTCGIELLWANPEQLPTSALRLSDLDALAGIDLRH